MNVLQPAAFRQFKHGLIRKPPQSMSSGLTTQKQAVDLTLAQQQHQAYENTLRSLNINLKVLSPEELFPDCHFVEDTAIVHNGFAVMMRPGAKVRRAEGDSVRKALADSLAVVDLDLLANDDEATIDGGDVIFMGREVLIGISDRTTMSGAKALANVLKSIDPDLRCHLIEFSGLLHLKSGLTALNEERLLANTQITIKSPLPFGELIYVPSTESYAANALVINGAALYFAECQHAGDIIANSNLNPIPLHLSEFKKMDGSFTCLSLLW